MKRIIRGINKRNIITTSIIVLIFVMSLGYAALSQHMDLDGIATIDRSWIVKIKSMNCTTTGTAKVDSTNFISNTAVINGTLGDSSSKITCTIVLENQGNLKAKLGNVEVIEDDNKLITYSYTGVSEGTQLNPGESNTATVTINYVSGVTNIENTKKSVMLTFVYLENEPNTSNNPSPVPTSYEEYKVGDEVILLDGSKWTVTKASGKDEGLVTLLSKALLTSTGEYTTDSSKAYKVAFGSGATEYDTLTSGNIGYFIDNTYLPKAKAALNTAGGTTINTKARLLTTDEYNALYLKTPKSFAADSWETISKNINSDVYKVGDTRKVTLEGFGTFTLRIANKSTPTACQDTENFSQTACGFVVEFKDIITTHVMNSSNTNSGGWEKSAMRTYVNQDIYEALPDDLKAVIIETNVISGHGSGDGSNFKTTDKLYLLSTHEVWAQGSSNKINYDTAYDLTRQLDYYENQGVTTSNYSYAKKYLESTTTYWWLRAAGSNYPTGFYFVSTDGDWHDINANVTGGVAPAFRIGNVENFGNDGSIWGMTKCSRGFMSYSVGDSEASSSCSTPTTTAYIQPVIITEKSNIKERDIPKPVSFATDSWETIKANVGSEVYQVGDTREIDLGDLGVHTLRIANKSTPEECKDTENFSQTACGFVVEFEDIITEHVMNSTGTSGGWQKSEMREYVNNDIYEALPDDLKEVIIDTNVISEHEYGVSVNYKTKDKLYLLSTMEVEGYGTTITSITRQLDYYRSNGAHYNKSIVAKQYNGRTDLWFLREPYKYENDHDYWHIGSENGAGGMASASYKEGVSPAFRIAESTIISSFATDSWKTIKANVNTGVYATGDTREIDLGSLGKHTLRIANTTTPDVCKDTENFSQTACGFVVEFVDIITTHVMNSSETNIGGWEKSEMREYVNKDIYEALPDDLKNVIIETNVISGHEKGASANYKTKDKLYLLAPHEVWEKTTSETSNLEYDTAYDLTRQLDYYAWSKVTADSYFGVEKEYNGTTYAWWFRTAYTYYDNTSFYVASRYGNNGSSSANSTYDRHNGLSPAFRIG